MGRRQGDDVALGLGRDEEFRTGERCAEGRRRWHRRRGTAGWRRSTQRVVSGTDDVSFGGCLFGSTLDRQAVHTTALEDVPCATAGLDRRSDCMFRGKATVLMYVAHICLSPLYHSRRLPAGIYHAHVDVTFVACYALLCPTCKLHSRYGG